MTIVNITLPFGLIKDIKDYSRIINEILKHEISFNILKFSTSPTGITILLDIPEDKIKTITESLEKNNVILNKKGRISINWDKCVQCGACISLCPTDALHFDDEVKLEYSEDSCLACLICLDSCPRHAIEENF